MTSARGMKPLGGTLGPKIVAVGARSPLGLNALQVATAARAQKREVRASTLRDRRDARVGLVASRFLPEGLFGPHRMIRLAAPALREAAAALAQPVPLFLGLPAPDRPDLPKGEERELAARIAAESGALVEATKIEVFRTGHASFAFAMEAAMRAFAAGLSAAIVGCVDSYVDPRAVAWLDEAYRLHADKVEDGIIPSEGAAFVLLVATEDRHPGVFGPAIPPPLSVVRHVGTGSDPSALDPEGPITGAVATELVQNALASRAEPKAWLMTDIDEAHRITEWSRVELRCHPAFERSEHTRLPERFGNTGAATGALGAAYACLSYSLGSAPRGDTLLALAADGAERGVVLLSEAS